MLNPYFILQKFTTELKVQSPAEVLCKNYFFLFFVFFLSVSKNTGENTCAGVLFLTKMKAVKEISANRWF